MYTYNIKSNPFIHYLEEGYKLGYNPSTKFKNDIYYKMYPDVKKHDLNPLLHYELYGKDEKRLPGIPVINQGKYYPKKIKRFISRHINRILNVYKINKNKNSKTLVILHVFYMNSVDEIIEYLKNLECYNYDLIITYMEGMYYQKNLDKIKEFKPNTKFKKYNNNGFDIGPFIDVLNEINLKEYDIIIKLQTKSTTKNIYAYKQFFRERDWFLNLFDGVLGASSVHTTIDKLYNDTQYGIVAAKNLIVEDPPHKQTLVKENKKIHTSKNYKFVAGSCFAIRAKCLKEIQKEKLTIKDFEEVQRGIFTFGHIMERVICFTIENQNYEFYGNKVDFIRHLKYYKIERKLQKLSTLNLYDIKGIIIDNNAAIKYLEMGFKSNHEIISIKLKDIKEYPIKKDENYYKVKSNLKNGYDSKHLIIINQNNQVVDGNYRINILKETNKENYEIKVLKVNFISLDLNSIKPFSNKINQK